MGFGAGTHQRESICDRHHAKAAIQVLAGGAATRTYLRVGIRIAVPRTMP
jgi:hypothetical protein